MYKYKTLTGKKMEAETLHELAVALWHMMFVPDPTIEEWMIGSARRAKEWDGSIIRTTSPEEHVQDMIDAKLITPFE